MAALLAVYAVRLNPTVPILYKGSDVNDDYLPQLVGSVEAAVDHLVAIGVAAPDRIAVAAAGRRDADRAASPRPSP